MGKLDFRKLKLKKWEAGRLDNNSFWKVVT